MHVAGSTALVAFLGSLSMSAAELKIESMKHDIQQITAKNFDSVIGKFRDSTVSALWFFKDTKGDNSFLDEYNTIAKELKGMVKVCAISCTEWPIFCDQNKVETTPSVMLYPPNPIPAFLYKGKMEIKPLSSAMTKMVPSNVVMLTKEAADAFLTTDVTKPKVMLFSNKKNPPVILKALSSETVFKRTAKFAFIPESDTDLVNRFKVKKFPTLMLQAGEKAKTKEVYKGGMSFEAIRDWVNLFSESGMGDKLHAGSGKAEESAEEAKPWLVQEIPEVTRASHQDICFKGTGLCVIYLKEGTITPKETEMLEALSKKFTSQLSDRGTKMKWMWMDMAVETGFKKLFDVGGFPNIVVFNPHKRLRFTKIDPDTEKKGDEEGITYLLDKVLGGDAQFKIVPGQKLPSFANRDAKPAGKKEL